MTDAITLTTATAALGQVPFVVVIAVLLLGALFALLPALWRLHV